ncbi:MAG: MFS transporter [bacterium]|nr:MFS transporter [bacterium]
MAFGINRVSFKTIVFSSLTVWTGFYAWRILFNNFAVEVFDASATEVGIIQAVREVPGLLAFGVGALAVRFTESKIAAFSIVLLGLGLLLCGASPSLVMLGVATVVMSFGFHYFEPTNSSQLLVLSGNHELGRIQGRLRSYESMAGLGGAGLIFLLTVYLDFRSAFYLMGGLVTAVGLYLIVALPSNRGKEESRTLKLKSKYWLYYSLSFLRGCRRHVFTTFAIYLLVKNHSLDIQTISLIMLANSGITIFTHRLLGTVSDRWGEKLVLVTSSLLLVIIFTGYAYITFLPVLIGLYLVDNVLFGSSIALRSYLRKIAPSEDVTNCLSFGMTANHITAVVIPVAGGVMWNAYGYQTTFIAGAAIVFVDMLMASLIPGRSKLSS